MAQHEHHALAPPGRCWEAQKQRTPSQGKQEQFLAPGPGQGPAPGGRHPLPRAENIPNRPEQQGVSPGGPAEAGPGPAEAGQSPEEAQGRMGNGTVEDRGWLRGRKWGTQQHETHSRCQSQRPTSSSDREPRWKLATEPMLLRNVGPPPRWRQSAGAPLESVGPDPQQLQISPAAMATPATLAEHLARRVPEG